MHRLPARHTAANRHGFTLLELLLAIGLTSLLMAAIYGAMSTYWNLAMDSHEEIERAWVARTLLTRIAQDIQACTFSEHTDESFDDSSTDSEPEFDPTEMAVDEADEAETNPYRNGLIGTSSDLILYISHPDRSLDYVAAADAVGTTDRNSDLMIVRWLMAESGGGSLAAALLDQHVTQSDGSIAGLARGSGGVTGFGQAIDDNNTELQLESSELLASEVKDVLFEYFDGVDWVTEWNSAELNRMPQAVRIELTLRNAPDGDPGNTSSNPREPPDTKHSLVVPVPVASPYLEETAI